MGVVHPKPIFLILFGYTFVLMAFLLYINNKYLNLYNTINTKEFDLKEIAKNWVEDNKIHNLNQNINNNLELEPIIYQSNAIS